MKLILIRLYGNMGTNGYLLHDKRVLCKTIELPWRNNQPSISCIPEGSYNLRERFSTRFGRHLEILNVPNRSHILFHPANNALRELRGCIAPVTELVGQGLGNYSGMAFRKLMDRVCPVLEQGELVTLKIQT
jgi:hypothetical protein